MVTALVGGASAPTVASPDAVVGRASKPDANLHSLKGALCNLLWPGGGGCLYGHACTPELRVSNDEALRILLTHFGEERMLSLTADILAQVMREKGYPWRSYLGYMSRLRDLMTQELQSPTAVAGSAGTLAGSGGAVRKFEPRYPELSPAELAASDRARAEARAVAHRIPVPQEPTDV